MSHKEQLAYAAGVIDGEGSFTLVRHPYRAKCGNDHISLSMALSVGQKGNGDGPPQMLIRLLDTFGFGRIRQNTNRNGAFWTWGAYGLPKSQAALAMIWPWLGRTKREQAKRALMQVRTIQPRAGRHGCDGRCQLGGG